MAKKNKKDNLENKLGAELDDIMGVDIRNMAQEKHSGKKSKRRKKKGKKPVALIIVLLLLVAALAGGGVFFYNYYREAQQYKTAFFDQTFINGIDCSGMTAEQAKEEIRKQVETFHMTVTFKDGTNWELDGTDIQYKYEDDGEIAGILAAQDPMSWSTENKRTKEYTVADTTTYDENSLLNVVDAMPQLQPENQREPKDASIEFTEDTWVIVPEEPGTAIDREKLILGIKAAIETGESELNVETLGVYEEPAILAADEALVKQVENMNKLAGASITYKLPGEDKKLNGQTLIGWLDQDADGNYVKDEEKFAAGIAAFVKEMAEQVDTSDDKINFKTTCGKVVEIDCVDCGWKLNQEAEVKKLTELIENGEKVTREPEYTTRMASTENYGFGDTYIEVDLTEQQMYFYEEGKVVFQSEIVSGKMTKDRYTPAGAYYMDYKKMNRDLRGKRLPDGSYTYISHVNYWMSFHGGYGFHDATWRSKFGGTIYKRSGSHGCVNLPNAKAKELYSLITDDVPIAIFYEEDYSLGPAEPLKVATDEGPSKKTDDKKKTEDDKTDDKPSTDKPSTDKPSTDKPSTDKPSTDKPSTDKPSTDKPSTDKPSTDKPSTDKPSTDKPSTDNSGDTGSGGE